MRESASFVSKQLQSTAPISTWPPAILAMSEVVSPPSATLPLTPAHSKLLLQACVTDNGLNYWEIWLTEKNIHSSIFYCRFSYTPVVLEPIPAVFGRRQGTLKNNHLLSHSHLQTGLEFPTMKNFAN